MKARIYKSTGSWYIAKATDNRLYNARIKGIFKISNLSSTNPIAVGDEVEIEVENVAEKSSIINTIYDRKNYITRTSPHNKNQRHIVASNLDQAILFATLKNPRTSQGFIDRFLLSAEAYHIPATIIFNKSDLHKAKETALFDEWRKMYNTAGYNVLLISAQCDENMESIVDILKNKTTLLSGHSGVGKSTLINKLFPQLNLRTQEVSGWSGKGLHSTTFSEMYDLSVGGQIIDTPGIKEFGIIDISKQELSHYFPEMRNLIQDCQFNNCLHTNEPGCAVKTAVANNQLNANRYVSYCTILESLTK